MPPGKRRAPPKVLEHRRLVTKEVERLSELAASHLNATFERSASADEPPVAIDAPSEALVPPLPIMDSLSDATLTVDGQVGKYGMVVTRWTVYATQTGPLRGFPPRNRDVTIVGITVSSLDGESVVRQVSYWDAADLLAQLELMQRT